MKKRIQPFYNYGLAIFMTLCFQLKGTAQDNCLNFDGANDYVLSSAINPTSFTIETWIYAENTSTDQAIISTLNESSLKGCELHIGPNQTATITIRNSSGWLDLVSASGVVKLNGWTHLAATYNGTTAILYVNGIQVSSSASATYYQGNSNFTLGRRSSGGLFFDGSIEDSRIWNYALSQTEIQNNMYAILTGSETGLLCYYKFNQGTAGGSNSAITTAYDSKANSYNGTLNGFAYSGTSSNWISGLKGKPVDHVSSFASSYISSLITLSWVDVATEPTPDGYYIYATTNSSSFSAPVNGSEPTVDNDLSDGEGVVKVLQDGQTYNGWTNVTIESTYYFRIYPFTSSGITANYKTDGTVPQTQITIPQFTSSSFTAADLTYSGFADFNNDGNIDIASIGHSSNNINLYKSNASNNFTAVTNSLTALMDGSVCWGDYDNDGYMDLLTTGTTKLNTYSLAQTILYRNNGDETFTATANSFAGVYLGAAAFGDYNNDGYLDIAVGGQTTTAEYITYIYRNNGDGSFTQQTKFNLKGITGGTGYDAKIIWADLNNDGFLDLVLNSVESTYIYKNTGNDSFEYTSGFSPYQGYSGMSHVDIGDANNDGLPDILRSGCDWNGGYIFYYLNYGDFSFSDTNCILYSGYYPKTTFWADYNNDGFLDIICNDHIYKNNADSTFTYQSSNSFSGNLTSAFDIDHDGDLDFLSTNKILYINNTTNQLPDLTVPENLQSTVTKDSTVLTWSKDENINTYYAILVIDPSGDTLYAPQALSDGTRLLPGYNFLLKDTSLVVQNNGFGSYSWTVQKVNQNGTGGPFATTQSFEVKKIQASNLTSTYISSSSVKLNWTRGNGDGCIVFAKEGINDASYPVDEVQYLDIPVYKSGSQIGSTGWYCVYDNIDSTVTITGLSAYTYYTFEVFEYERDNEKNYYFKTADTNNIASFGTSLLTDRSDFIDFEIGGSVSWVDYDDDNDLDLLASGEFYWSTAGYYHGGDSTLLLNNAGNHEFNPVISGIENLEWVTSSWADYDKDNDLDLLIAGSPYSNIKPDIAKIYKNDKSGVFTEASEIALTPIALGTAEWQDFNNDGNEDILIAGRTSGTTSGSTYFLIYKNLGNGTFSDSIVFKEALTISEYCTAHCADYNNDGLTDILLTTAEGTTLYKNTGNFNFEEQANLPFTSFTYMNAAWSDYNNDGYKDLLLSATESTAINKQTLLYKNNGDGSFELQSTSFIDLYENMIKWTDINNDGFQDIIYSGLIPYAEGLNSVVYQNNGDGSFTQRDDLSLLKARNGTICSGDYDNDGDNDIVISGQANVSGTSNLTKLHENNLIGQAQTIANTAPNKVTGLQSITNLGSTTMGWNEGSDEQTPGVALTYNLKLWNTDSSNYVIAPHSDSLTGFRYLAQLGNMEYARTITLPDLTPGTYHSQVQAVDGGFMGGSWSDTITFIVKAAQAYFTFDTVCLGDTTHFTDNSDAYSGITAWKWNFGDTTSISTLQNPTHIYQYSGEHNVKLVVFNADGETDTIINTILVKAAPKVNFTATNVCTGTTTVITNNTAVSDIESWSWNFGDDKTSIYANPGSHVYSSLGSYTITLKAEASNGCSSEASQSIVVTTTPSAILTLEYGSSTFCKGDSVIYSVPSGADYSYQWQRDGENINNTTNQLTVKTIAGSYQVIITNNLASTCADTSVLKTINIHDKPATPVINAESATSFCNGDSVKISTAVTGYTFKWLPEGTGSTNKAYFYATQDGKYRLITSNDYCTSDTSNTIEVIVTDNPEIKNFTYGETQLCEGETVSFSVTNNSTYAYQWMNGNAEISSATSYSYKATESGNYWLKATSQDGGCTTETDTVEVNIDPLPATPNISEENNISTFCPGTELNLVVDNADEELYYQWKRSGISISGATDPNYSGPLKEGDYSVQVSSGGCSVESEILTLTAKDAPEKPEISAALPDEWLIICSNESASSYRWYYNDELISGATANYYYAKQNLGDYYVEINEGGECWTSSDIINIPTLEISTEINELIVGLVSVYPNPSEGVFHIDLGGQLNGKIDVDILDATGKTILSEQYKNTNTFDMDLSTMNQGVYLCKITNDASVVILRMVKQ